MKKTFLIILTILSLLFSIGSKSEWRSFGGAADEMTGKISMYAAGPTSYPLKKLDFPYSDLSSRLLIGCNKDDGYWAYINFKPSINITNGRITFSGGKVIGTRVKWDDLEPDYTQLTKSSGSKTLFFENDEYAVGNIKRHHNLRVAHKWYGNYTIYFDHNLSGASKAIKQLEKVCGKPPIYYSAQEIEKKESGIRNKNLNEEISKLPSTNFAANHSKESSEIISDITKVMKGWGFTLMAATDSAMKWSHPGRPSKKPRKLLNCGWTFGMPTWAHPAFSAEGAIYTYFNDNQVFINWIVKGKHCSTPKCAKDCRSTGRVENSVLSAVAGEKIKIKP